MELESLNCDHCGAPLEIPLTATFVKCNHCGSQLAVRRSESVAFTERVEQLAETTEHLTERISELTRQNELSALDRRWEREQEAFMWKDSTGKLHPPAKSATLVGILLAAFTCFIFVPVLFTSDHVPPFVRWVFFPAMILTVVILGIRLSVRANQNVDRYQSALARYKEERAKLLDS